jgi:adenosylcobinamide kinase/adenosylcobinamide-phosphate guanylyltransferase
MAPETRRVLVLGGARSGKSAHAEALGAAHGGPLTYIATAQALDAEMRERIACHRARRGGSWRTLEAPVDLEAALAAAAGPGRFVLVDCITLWLSNLMHAHADAEASVERLCAALCDLAGTIVLVSNEVGLGIVPDNALARSYADQAGLMNQNVATAAGKVVLMSAGLPQILKDRAA